MAPVPAGKREHETRIAWPCYLQSLATAVTRLPSPVLPRGSSCLLLRLQIFSICRRTCRFHLAPERSCPFCCRRIVSTIFFCFRFVFTSVEVVETSFASGLERGRKTRALCRLMMVTRVTSESFTRAPSFVGKLFAPFLNGSGHPRLAEGFHQHFPGRYVLFFATTIRHRFSDECCGAVVTHRVWEEKLSFFLAHFPQLPWK